MKRKASIDPERCKSCELCMQVCRQGTLQMTNHINSRGYKHIALDDSVCVGCGLCYIVCPDGVFTIEEKEEA